MTKIKNKTNIYSSIAILIIGVVYGLCLIISSANNIKSADLSVCYGDGEFSGVSLQSESGRALCVGSLENEYSRADSYYETLQVIGYTTIVTSIMLAILAYSNKK